MSLQSLIATGTKLWLDSVEPELVKKNRALGATGATSNPIIISDIIKRGTFRREDRPSWSRQGLDDDAIAWELDDQLVAKTHRQFFFPSGNRPTATTATSASSSIRCWKTWPTPIAACKGRESVYRAGQEVVGRAQEPDDQGSRDCRRPRRAGRTRGRRNHAECHADFLRAAIQARPRGRVARCAAHEPTDWLGSRAFTAFSSPAWMCTRKRTCRT